MNISLADPSIVIGDTVLPMGDDSVPMWDLVYAHHIGVAPVTHLPNPDSNEESENATART
jgi:hypothetical protein